MSENHGVILVVEDELILRKAIVKKLQIGGYGILEAGSGEEAMNLLNNSSLLPDVIWLDYYLPDTDGMEFMQRINREARLKEVPVVVVSNSASPEVVEKMLGLGAKEYLLKVDRKLEDIVRVVATFIKN